LNHIVILPNVVNIAIYTPPIEAKTKASQNLKITKRKLNIYSYHSNLGAFFSIFDSVNGKVRY
jgi:hypothetical protein